ncbi:MAG: hypothetical protein QMD46_09320 [Methanomicrobiales archaeon]|nr:hypothetical protein [Methanomicrobiales archaeon]MDI6876714.1 hypothetical protein [Methanomicrobiales archaeon]
MPYTWKNRYDVDETVLVIQNTLERGQGVPAWLKKTVRSALSRADPELTQYFFGELDRFAPGAEAEFRES